jgi:hypothetical protein
MEPILAEIEKALDAGLYYLAVMLAVAIPDICGALESKDGRSGPVQYKAWYDAHLANRIYDLTADDCYSLGVASFIKASSAWPERSTTAPSFCYRKAKIRWLLAR